MIVSDKLAHRGAAVALCSAALLATTHAVAADDPSAPEKQPLSAEPSAPGPMQVNFRDYIRDSDSWTWQTHGFLRAPMAISSGQRGEAASDGQRSTTWHTPPLVPDREWGSWLQNNHSPQTWANFLFSYGNKYASGTVGIGAYNFAATQTGGGTGPVTVLNAEESVIFGPVFVTLRTPELLDGNARVELVGGSFSNRYGLAGKYDWGQYQMPLIGNTAMVGATLAGEYDLLDHDLTLRLEGGFGTNNYPQVYEQNEPLGTTMLGHVHLFANYRDEIRGGLHFLHNWTGDDRVNPDGSGRPDGKFSVVGAEVRFNGQQFGEYYLAYSGIFASDAIGVAPVLQVVNANGGNGLVDNFLGRQSGGTGTIHNILFQLDYSIATLLAKGDFYGEGPDITLSLFGLFTAVSADTAEGFTANPWDGVNKLKIGFEGMYIPLQWLSAGVRWDSTMPNLDEGSQSFHSISPKVLFKSNFITHEFIRVQYTHYFYGDSVPLAPNVFQDVTGPKRPITQPGQTALYDTDMLYIAAEMWW